MIGAEWVAAGALLVAATAGIAALARLAGLSDPAERFWVHCVVEQLDAHGMYDDGLIRVYIGLDPDRPLYPYALGWTIHAGEVADWTADRAELRRRLREHYRTSRARARSEVA